MKSLILFSGGTDSTTCLALAKSRGEEVVCVSLTYGQKHAEPELAAAETIAGHYGVHWHLLDVSNIFFASESSLTRADRKIPRRTLSTEPQHGSRISKRRLFVSDGLSGPAVSCR